MPKWPSENSQVQQMRPMSDFYACAWPVSLLKCAALDDRRRRRAIILRLLRAMCDPNSLTTVVALVTATITCAWTRRPTADAGPVQHQPSRSEAPPPASEGRHRQAKRRQGTNARTVHPTGTPVAAERNAPWASSQCFMELPVLPYAKCPYDCLKYIRCR